MRNRTQRYKRRSKAKPINKKPEPKTIQEVAQKVGMNTSEFVKFYKHKFEGEPFLTGYGLYPKIKKDTDRIPYDYLMAYTDGYLSLIDIADKAGIPITYFDQAVSEMLYKDLIHKL